MTAPIGKLLILIGLFLIISGIILVLSPKIPWLGKLPGDIHYQGKHVRIVFPLATCLVLSVLLTIIISFLSRK